MCQFLYLAGCKYFRGAVMSRIFLASLAFSLAFGATRVAFAGESPSVHSCKVIQTWWEGRSASEICSRNGGSFCGTADNKGQGICNGMHGSFCSSVKNTGQGICNGLGGSFCSSVENTPQGICFGLKESFCSSLKSGDQRNWIEKLAKACELPKPSSAFED